MAPFTESAADRWRQRATSQGLLLQRPKLQQQQQLASTTTLFSETGRHCGVSLHYLRCLAQSLGPDEAEGSTASVMHRFLLPALAKLTSKKRLWEAIPAEHTGMPHWYICHDWSESFTDLVAAVDSDLRPRASQGQEQDPLAAQAQAHNTFVWIDIFAVNHYSPSAQAEDAAEAVEEALDTCSQGLMLVVGRGMACMDNVTCLHEVFFMAYSKGEASVRLTLPDLGLEQTLALRRLCASIDVSKAGAGKPQDKTFILSEVRRRIGLKRTNLLLAQVLSNALFCKLRWGGSLTHAASLAAALLKAGELCQLQLLLGGLEQLKHDDSSMKEMVELFKSFDTDGSGELDEAEFMLVLHAAGYSDDDALTAFSDINSSGSGLVSLQEFQAWWMQRQGDEHPELTYPALWDKVKALIKVLDNKGLGEHAQLFRSASRQIEDYADYSTRQALPPPCFKGDLQALLDNLSYKIHTEQPAACSLLLEFMLRNTEVMHIDPATIPAARRTGKHHDQPLLLALYMLTVVELFETYHLLAEKRSLVDFLLTTAAQLQADSVNRKKPLMERQKSGLPSSCAIAEILKSQSGAVLVSKGQVANFQKSISEFMAGARKSRRGSVLGAQEALSALSGGGGGGHGRRAVGPAASAARVGPALVALRAALLEQPGLAAATFRQDPSRCADLAPSPRRASLDQTGRGGSTPSLCERSAKSSPNIARLFEPAAVADEEPEAELPTDGNGVPVFSPAAPVRTRRPSLLTVGSCSMRLQSMSEVLCRIRAGEDDEPPPASGSTTERVVRRPPHRGRARRVSLMMPGRVSFVGGALAPPSDPFADPLLRQQESQLVDLPQPSPFSNIAPPADALETTPEPAAGRKPAPLGRSRSHVIHRMDSSQQPPHLACRLPSMLRQCGSQLGISRAESQPDAVQQPPGFPTLRLPDLRRHKAAACAAGATAGLSTD